MPQARERESQRRPFVVPLSAGGPGGPAPGGWRWTPLQKVARLESGHTPSRARPDWWGGSIPWIALPDIRALDGKVAYATAEYTNDEGIANSAARVLPPGTVVLSRTASVGFVTIMGCSMATSQDFFAWVCGEDLVPEFLAYLLRRSREFVRSLASGAVHGTVYMPTAESFWACLPPVAEQRRIVAALDQELAAAERARAAAEARFEAAEQLAASHLRVAFSESASRGWSRVPLRDLAEIVSGITLGRRPPQAPLRPVPYLRVANVKDGHLALQDVYSIEASASEITKWRLRKGDLLLTEGGDPDKLGRGTFWEEQIPECIHQNHIFRVRFRAEAVLPEFAAAQVSSPHGKSYFLKHAKRTTGIATINQKVLGDFPFLLTTRGEQQAIAERLRWEMNVARSVCTAAGAELAAINALPAALLHRAFSGEA